MITDVLLNHPWLAPAALVVLLVAGPPVAASLLDRPRLLWLLAGISLIPVAVLTLAPVSRELFARCEVQWLLPTPRRVESFANLVLFVAPVLLAGAATRRPLLVLVAASALSAAVEGLQAAVPAIGRSCDTGDWLSNTLGAAAGAALAVLALRLERRAAPELTGPRD